MRIGFALVSVLIAFAAFGFEVKTMRYREKDGGTIHLYEANCLSTKPPRCSLKAISLSGEKATSKCTLNIQDLISDQIAQMPQADTFVVSSTAGACGYTNTYTFSPNGMVQMKTSPNTIPSNLKGTCETFAPKSYSATVNEKDKLGFVDVPFGNCTSVNVIN